LFAAPAAPALIPVDGVPAPDAGVPEAEPLATALAGEDADGAALPAAGFVAVAPAPVAAEAAGALDVVALLAAALGAVELGATVAVAAPPQAVSSSMPINIHGRKSCLRLVVLTRDAPYLRACQSLADRREPSISLRASLLDARAAPSAPHRRGHNAHPRAAPSPV